MKNRFLHLCFFLVPLVIFAQKNNYATAEQILEKAYDESYNTNKNIFIKFTASWCSWCKLMDKKMNLPKTQSFFKNNYIDINFNVLESNKQLNTPGADAFLSQWGGNNKGIPFWVILNSSGNVIGNSFDSLGNNIGCPTEQSEVDTFMKVLSETSYLSSYELNIIKTVFLKKEE